MAKILMQELIKNVNNLITEFYIKEIENIKPDPRAEFRTAAEKAVYLQTFNIVKKEAVKILSKHRVSTERKEGEE